MTNKAKGLIIIFLLIGFLFGCDFLALPSLSVGPSHLNFGFSQNYLQFEIINDGAGQLEWEISPDYPQWLTLDQTEGVNNAVITAEVLRQNLSPGEYTANLKINSNHRDKIVSILVQVPKDEDSYPSLSVNPTYLDFGSFIETQFFKIKNKGQETLNWSIDYDAPWLELDVVAGVDDQVIYVSVQREGLIPGEYQTDLVIASNDIDTFLRVGMKVKEPSQVNPPLDVSFFDVRGLTLPEGEFSYQALNQIELPLENIPCFQAMDKIKTQQMHADFEGGFLFAWSYSVGATGYLLLEYDDQVGDYLIKKDLSLECLENYQEPTYGYLDPDYDVGQIKTFKIIPYNEGGLAAASAPKQGIIIGPTILQSPSNLSSAPATPTFSWNLIEGVRGYNLKLWQDKQLYWDYVLADADSNQVKYPGDDNREPLSANNYSWRIITLGPVLDGSIASISISKEWSFEVAP